jgi:predicted alpha/beta-fold hydrolase
VKYLGEEGEKKPLSGAVAICCPWDLVGLQIGNA